MQVLFVVLVDLLLLVALSSTVFLIGELRKVLTQPSSALRGRLVFLTRHMRRHRVGSRYRKVEDDVSASIESPV